MNFPVCAGSLRSVAKDMRIKADALELIADAIDSQYHYDKMKRVCSLHNRVLRRDETCVECEALSK